MDGGDPLRTARARAIRRRVVAGRAYRGLQAIIIRHQGEGSLLARALGRDRKGLVSPLLYAAAIPASFFAPWLAGAIYVGVAALWLVPDKRIERALSAQ